MNIAGYQERLNYEGDYGADIATLRALHRAHMLTIPFENLNIMLKQAHRPGRTGAVSQDHRLSAWWFLLRVKRSVCGATQGDWFSGRFSFCTCLDRRRV